MFTIADIRNIAIQIEMNGEQSYRMASEAASDPELKELFSLMADDEKRHREWFERIQSDQVLTEEQMEMEAIGKSLLQEMVKDKTFSLEKGELNKVVDLEELIVKSKGFESDTILFYEMLCGFVDEGETMEELQKIIAEEQRHLKELKELFEKMAAEA